MKAGAAKANKTRSVKARKRRPNERASYVLVALSALLWLFTAGARDSLWAASALAELSLWLGLGTALLGGAHALLAQWDRAAAGALIAGLWLWPLSSFVQHERPTPTHGPTLVLRHYHLGNEMPARSTFESLLLAQGVHVVSLTFSSDELAKKAPRPPDGFRRMSALGAGPRVLWVRELEPGSGPSTLRVGGCSVALQQVSLPNIFDWSRRAERERLLAALDRRSSHQPGIWLGHLGSSPGARDVAPVARAQDYRDARVRQGFMASFPALFGPLGLPLDPLLVHGWISVRQLAPIDGSALGATHRGLRAELELTEPRCARPVRRVR